MADYSAEIQDAFDSIKEAGGVIYLAMPNSDAPTDPDLPWEGNDKDPEPFAHYAALFPLTQESKQNAESNHRVIIPAANLPDGFEITMNQEFTDAKGRKYAITAISLLAPDPTQLILYDCECALWPTAN